MQSMRRVICCIFIPSSVIIGRHAGTFSPPAQT
jgi:hypothetical protein